ncbi:hypothetical protein HN018_12850 [Lichenicola cladoniae]|uniref:Uncharacterized protein n=1 Tax=Lichenicola cladoniae TaxID=1484109 RepID=A0A6M8HRG8_9PROT|nr:hypothetical protein [Lichenicola cladoniae]NPD68765.1 hypothetical protein [Acetobacteraceae bacterium]QKE90811.1 hypothetical protein HN018_12850 [Lichenicola cladoniae]
MAGMLSSEHATTSSGCLIPLIVNAPSDVVPGCETSGFFSGIVVGLAAMVPFWTTTILLGARLLNHV